MLLHQAIDVAPYKAQEALSAQNFCPPYNLLPFLLRAYFYGQYCFAKLEPQPNSPLIVVPPWIASRGTGRNLQARDRDVHGPLQLRGNSVLLDHELQSRRERDSLF